MNTSDLIQGSAEWHEHRATHFNASDAPAMMGLSPYKTRSELLREMATGITEDIDSAKQRRFDDGHRFEALARPVAEKILGEALFPVVGYEGKLSASFDGLTMDESVCFEHKTLNAAYREAIATGSTLPPALLVQIEQQLMLADATRCLFMASKWQKAPGSDEEPGKVYGFAVDENGDIVRYMQVDEVHCFVESDPELRKTLLQGWKQFQADLANYQHVEAAPVVVAAPIKDLSPLIITATGSLSVETNFAKWEIELRDFIKRIPEKPSTDQEFEDCKAALAAFKKAEAALDAEEARVLTLVPSVDDMRRHKKLLRDLSSTTRLALEKLVVRRDIDVKNEIMQKGKDGIDAHIKALNTRLGGQYMPATRPNFAEAIKSKRNYANMRDAVDAMLANAKVEADMTADRIEVNWNALSVARGDGPPTYLFPDFATHCTKAPEDFAALLFQRQQQDEQRKAAAKAAEDARVAAAVEAERKAGEARAAAEAERIRKEEAAKLEAAKIAAAPVKTENFAAAIHEAGTAHPLGQLTAAHATATPEQKQAAVIEHQDDIAEFMGSREWGKDAGKIRAALVEFVKFQADRRLKVAA